MGKSTTSLRFPCVFLLYMSVFMTNRSEAAKILGIFPTPSYSHQQSLISLSYALGARGHNLTIITTNPSKEPMKNVREIDISSLYDDFMEAQKHGPVSLQKRADPLDMIHHMCPFLNMVFDLISKKPQILQLIKELNGTKYDLILYEPLLYSSLLGFAEITGNPPIIAVATVHTFPFMDDPMGNPMLSSYVPAVMLPHTDHMTLYQRIFNLYADLYTLYYMETCSFPKQQEYLEKLFGNVRHTAKELEYNKSLMIVSTDWATGYSKPHNPNTIYVGPLHIKNPGPLPQDIKKWMDESEEGVIYFSLGSNMKGKSVPAHIREMFIKAFKQFPKVRVLWKWEADTDLPGRPDNVLAKKWLPQQSILAHRKLKLFITQVGLQSLQETINNKVPILGIPMFGDQDFNAKKILREGVGRILEFNNLSYEDIYENIKAMLTNGSYKENMERLWWISNDKPMSAMDTAIWWVEYVIRHKGAPHLRPASLDLKWYQLYMFDIVSIFISIVLVLLASLFFIIRFLIVSFKKEKKKLKTK